jgi:hypothetical protein
MPRMMDGNMENPVATYHITAYLLDVLGATPLTSR